MKAWGNMTDFKKISGIHILSLKMFYKKGKIPKHLFIVEYGLHQDKYKINLPGLLQYIKDNRNEFKTSIKDKF